MGSPGLPPCCLRPSICDSWARRGLLARSFGALLGCSWAASVAIFASFVFASSPVISLRSPRGHAACRAVTIGLSWRLLGQISGLRLGPLGALLGCAWALLALIFFSIAFASFRALPLSISWACLRPGWRSLGCLLGSSWLLLATFLQHRIILTVIRVTSKVLSRSNHMHSRLDTCIHLVCA